MSTTVVIKNPAVFMTAKYIEKKALVDDFEGGTINVIEKYGCPCKVFILFDDEETCEKFIETYNGKSFEDNIE